MGEVTRATSQAIYTDSLNAYSDPGHPCHVFRKLQHYVPDSLWQLPEPFNGASALSGLVFLGKTALLAQLVKHRGYVHHFNVAALNIRIAPQFIEKCARS